MKNEYFNQHTKEAFLAGDVMVLKDLGAKYLSILGKPPIPDDKLNAFLKGSPEYLQPIGEGWGMSTDDALRCLFDSNRTVLFIKGIVNTVKQLKLQFPGQELTAVEAGCGTGVLALALANAGVNHVIGIEINLHTARATSEFINELKMSEKIKIVNDDATIFNPGKPIDIIVSENMHTGLFFEPQAQIVSNLKKYLNLNGVVIPHEVNLYYAPASIEWDNIGKDQIELRKVDPSLIKEVGNFSCFPRIDFTQTIPSVISGYIPLLKKPMNGLVVEMDVNISNGNILKSGRAEFLGQPHLVKVEITNADGKDFALIYYQPGKNPPKQLFKFKK